jgi:biopolymer transport protein ExbD
MHPRRRTAVLIVILAGISAWNFHHREGRVVSGTKVVLTHVCSWQEAFKTLGDDRLILVSIDQNNSRTINYMNFTSKEFIPEITEIMGTRSEQFLFLEADPDSSYGDVVKAIAELKAAEPKLSVMLLTKVRAKVNKSGLVSNDCQMNCPYPDDLKP